MREVYIDDQIFDAEKIKNKGAQLASLLLDQGCEEGERFAILLKNSRPYLECIWAARFSGVYYCPINWHYKGDEIRYLLSDSGAKVLITSKELYEPVKSFVPSTIKVLLVDSDGDLSYEKQISAFPPIKTLSNTPRGHMAYTSGTTGRPKGVIRIPPTPERLAARTINPDQVIEIGYGIKEGVRALQTAPIYHSAPSVYTQVALRKAECLVVMTRFDPETVLRLIEQHRIDRAYMVPIMFERLLALPEEIKNKYDLSTLEFIVSTGSPCPMHVKEQMIAWLGPIIYESYASSEAGLMTVISSEEALKKPGSAGKALGNGEIKICDEAGNELATGQTGYIYVNQPAYDDFTYLNRDEDRQAIALNHLVSMGDIGYLDEEGYLFVKDRTSDLVLSGGVNIYPAEVESYLGQHPDLLDVVVFGVADTQYGERLAAVAQVSTQNINKVTQEQLQDWLSEQITGFKVPKEIVITDQQLRQDNGKVSRYRLKKQFFSE